MLVEYLRSYDTNNTEYATKLLCGNVYSLQTKYLGQKELGNMVEATRGTYHTHLQKLSKMESIECRGLANIQGVQYSILLNHYSVVCSQLGLS